jgi:ribosomal protein S16
VVNRERLKHWLERGAQLSPTVHNLMVEQKLVQAEKVRVWKPKRKEKKSREKGKKEKKEEKVSGKADEKSGEAEKGAAA